MWQKISYGNGTTLDSDVANSEVSQKRERGRQEQYMNDIERWKVQFFCDFMTSKEEKSRYNTTNIVQNLRLSTK